MTSNSGCTSLAIVDLKEKEAQDAAAALVTEACGMSNLAFVIESVRLLTAFSKADGNMRPEDFKVIGVECDVSSERSVQKAYQNVMDTFGRIDSVVASAGTAVNRFATSHETDVDLHLFYPAHRYR